MKKIVCITGLMIAVVVAKGQNYNNNQPVINNAPPAVQQPVQPLNNPAQTTKPNQNSSFDNNSQQYNKGNTIKNAVPSPNGSYDVPGSQGTNNNNSPSFNNNNTPGTINNTGAGGTYTPAGTLQK